MQVLVIEMSACPNNIFSLQGVCYWTIEDFWLEKDIPSEGQKDLKTKEQTRS